jgi:hypothetical protein
MDFSSLRGLHVSFTNKALSGFAQSNVPDFDSFFDEDDSTALNDDLMDVLVHQVPEVLFMSCTGDQSRVPALIFKCIYKYHSPDSGGTTNLRNQNDMMEFFHSAVRSNRSILKVTVHTEQLFFHPDFNGSNLDMIFTSNQELRAFINAVSPSSYLPIPAGSSAAITQPPPVPSNEFRHHLLPPDVKDRYDDYMNPDIIVSVHELRSFLATSTTPKRLKYFHDTTIAGDKVILRNGSVLTSKLDLKLFHKNVPVCLNTSPHGLRVWYKRFSMHGNSCGLFVVPYELLSKHHGGALGFAFDDDLPAFKSCYCFEWAANILLALQSSTMFPVDSIPAQRVKHCDNGYYGLIAILHDTHPAFVVHPVSLCKNWPEQKSGQSIFDFHAEFTEAISLRAIYMDDAQDMNSPTIMDTFLHNCLHFEYLLAAVRIDSIDPLTQLTLTPGNLAITLNSYLSRSDSPSQVIPSPAPSSNRFNAGAPGGFPRRAFPRRINALGEEADSNYNAELEEALNANMPSMIHALKNNGPLLRHCMFCGVGENHLFDQCPIVNEQEFLHSFAIRVGSAYQRTLNDAFKRQKIARGITTDDDAPRGAPSSSARFNVAARIHQVFGLSADVPQDDSGAAPSPTASASVSGSGSDFRQG